MIKKLFVALATASFVFVAQTSSASAQWPGTSWTQDGVPVHMISERGYVSNVKVHDESDLYFSVYVAGNQTGNPGAINVNLTPVAADCDTTGTGIFAVIYHSGNPGGENANCSNGVRGIWFQMNWDNGYRRYHPNLGVAGQGVTEYIIRVGVRLGGYSGTTSKGYSFTASSPMPFAEFGVSPGLPINFIADKAQGSFTNMFITQQGPCDAAAGGTVVGHDFDNWGANRAQNDGGGNWVAMAESFRLWGGPDVWSTPAGGTWLDLGGYVWRPGSGSGGTDSLSVATSPWSKYSTVLHSIGRNNYVQMTFPFSGYPSVCVPPPPPPPSVTLRSYVNGVEGDIGVDAESGNTFFQHTLDTTQWNGTPSTISYTIDEYISTDHSCSTGGAWVRRKTDSATINSWWDAEVWAVSSGWDRNTTKRICQQFTVTDGNGAFLTSNPTTRYADVNAGVITVSATASSGTAAQGEAIPMNGTVVARAEGGNSYALTYSITYTTVGAFGMAAPAAVSGTVTINDSVNNSTFSNAQTITIPNNAVPGSQICVRTVVTAPTLVRYFTLSVKDENRCILIVSKPIFSIEGGDIIAGVGVQGASCASYPNRGVQGWNKGVAGGFIGAGTGLAAFSTGEIKGFATARAAVLNAQIGNGLAFSNTPSDSQAGGDKYGSGHVAVPCIPNYWAMRPVVDNPLSNMNKIGDVNPGTGIYTIGDGVSDLATSATTQRINRGVQQVVYVNGDLRILNDIIYQQRGTWVSAADIPRLVLVVTGDIWIKESVRQLDGIFIASGTIHTCSDNGAKVDASPLAVNYFAKCGTQLIVNGVFIANKLDLRRSYGNIGELPAEVFNYRPEIWLSQMPKTSAGQGTNKFDNVTSLPPVL